MMKMIRTLIGTIGAIGFIAGFIATGLQHNVIYGFAGIIVLVATIRMANEDFKEEA